MNDTLAKNLGQKRHRKSTINTSIGKVQEKQEHHHALSSNYENSSMDFHVEKTKKKSIHILEDRFKNSKFLKDFLYTTHSHLNDFEKDAYEKRVEQLRKYAKWKTTKWVKKSQR